MGPAYAGIELGLGETLLIKSIASATGSSIARTKQELEEKGDIGLVAESNRSNQRTMFQPRPLTVTGIFKVLREIAILSGHNAMGRKVEKVRALFVACQGSESKYLFRLLEGKLRVGLAEQSVLAALAHASAQIFGEIPPEADPVATIKSVYNSLPDYGAIIPVLLKHGIARLPDHCHLTPGVPLKPMLAFPTRSISEVLDRFEKLSFTCEYKYDGERAQVLRIQIRSLLILVRFIS